MSAQRVVEEGMTLNERFSKLPARVSEPQEFEIKVAKHAKVVRKTQQEEKAAARKEAVIFAKRQGTGAKPGHGPTSLRAKQSVKKAQKERQSVESQPRLQIKRPPRGAKAISAVSTRARGGTSARRGVSRGGAVTVGNRNGRSPSGRTASANGTSVRAVRGAKSTRGRSGAVRGRSGDRSADKSRSVSKEDLDAELDRYLGHAPSSTATHSEQPSNSKQNPRALALDKELDDYFKT